MGLNQNNDKKLYTSFKPDFKCSFKLRKKVKSEKKKLKRKKKTRNHTKMRPIFIRCSLSRTFLSLILILVTNNAIEHTNAAGRQPPPTVEINKCCRFGESLDRNKQCTIGGTDKWWPLIYLVAKGVYFKEGEAPRFIRAIESKQPSCEQPEIILNRIALFSNGSLFLSERNSFIDRNNYCIDKDIALVCLPNVNGADSLTHTVKLTKIRKCCSIDSIYLTHGQSCVPAEDRSHKLFETTNISNIDLVYGFPICHNHNENNYVIADHFREHNLNVDNGTYMLENTHKILTNDEFCIDHTNKNGSMVFACDDLVAIKELPAPKIEEVCC